MKIISFNVNSVRMRQHQLQALVQKHQPQIIALQETKVTDGDFPFAEMAELGYHAEVWGQKTHYGVANLSLTPPITTQKGFVGDTAEDQKRLIMGTWQTPIGMLHVINGYFPQGESREHPTKFPAKAKFYADLLELLERFSPQDHLVVLGDFNVAPDDADVGIGEANAKRWLRSGKTSFLPEERQWFTNLIAWGLVDTYAYQHPHHRDLSWFDYRSRGFEQEPRHGLRIDHILISHSLLPYLTDTGIDLEIRAMDKPSDHCPIWISLNV